MKSVVFLLPCSAALPVGGFKVVYEYANRLVQDGIIVHIVYASVLFPEEYSFGYQYRRKKNFWKQKFKKDYLPDKWFDLDPRVKQKWVYTLLQKNVPVGDCYVATSWETAEYLDSYKGISDDRKYYLIQSYEKWSCRNNEQRLLATWKASLNKIVIASWLKNIANELGEKAELVENGFDFNHFKITIDIQKRDPFRVVMLYHEAEAKGLMDAFLALEIVKQRFSNLSVNLFGVFSKPEVLPSWYEYYQMPSKETLNRLYNEASVYMGPSHMEGWCLTLGEAMQCGCAVACTNIDGYAVMAHHEETALVSLVRDPEGLATNVIRLLEDNGLRYRLAEKGNKYIKQYTWERAYRQFKRIVIGYE